MEFLTFFLIWGWLLVDYSHYPSNNNLLPVLYTRRTVPSHTWDPRKESIYNYWGPQVTTPLVAGRGHKMTVPTTRRSGWLASLGFLVQFETSCLVLILRRITWGPSRSNMPYLVKPPAWGHSSIAQNGRAPVTGMGRNTSGSDRGFAQEVQKLEPSPAVYSLRSRGMVQSCDQSHLAGDERQAHSYHPSSIHLESKLFHLLVQGCGSSRTTKSLCPILFHSPQSPIRTQNFHPEWSRARRAGALARTLLVSHLGLCRGTGWAMSSTTWSLPLWSRYRSIQQ